MTSFDNNQYDNALRGTRTAAPESAEFANGPIDSQDSDIVTGNIEYVKYAGIRDRIHTDKPVTSGNILMLCPSNMDGGMVGMSAEIANLHPDVWTFYQQAFNAGQIEPDGILVVQAETRVRDNETGRNVTLFKNGRKVMSRLFVGFIPVKDRFGTREEPVHATIEFATPALERLAYAAQVGYLHELGITEIRTPKLATGKKQPWSVVAPVMLANLAATGLHVRIHLSAEDVEYDLTTDGQLIERKGQVTSDRIIRSI